MTLMHSALAGGDCIDDADRMRAASTPAVLGHGLRAPSTLGLFRSFTWGHVSQLDRVAEEAMGAAWAAVRVRLCVDPSVTSKQHPLRSPKMVKRVRPPV